MNRIIVAFESESVSRRVCELLAAASIQVRSIHRSGAEVVRAIQYMGGGIVLCGAKLPDTTADNLYDDLDGTAYILVIGKPEQLEICENRNLFHLPLPINRYDLAASVRMLQQLEEMSLQRPRRTRAEEDAIQRAKSVLQNRMGMSETLAHRSLQKKSMDAGIRIADMAQRILEQFPDAT